MTIRWTISHDERLVVATCEGEVSRADYESYLDDVVVKGAMSYAKVFDMADGLPVFAADDPEMMQLAARIQAYANQSSEPMGALAIVAATDRQVDFARMYSALATARRPIKIFGTQQAALAWLAKPK
ncbi:MAG: STAS/SEC14 domain-containing protein [Alphaproteobacteria bacterium]|nr:STAS/SEC14 domain-containing protein [Alphaproteobacteria bacterium]